MWLINSEEASFPCNETEAITMETQDTSDIVVCCKDANHSLPLKDYYKTPGAMYEEDIILFSKQILAGLSHLEQLKVSK